MDNRKFKNVEDLGKWIDEHKPDLMTYKAVTDATYLFVATLQARMMIENGSQSLAIDLLAGMPSIYDNKQFVVDFLAVFYDDGVSEDEIKATDDEIESLLRNYFNIEYDVDSGEVTQYTDPV